MNKIKIYINTELENEIELTKENGYLISLPTNQLFKLDETFDEANFEFYSSINENIKPFTKFKVIKEQKSNTETTFYYGYSEIENVNLKKGIYKHFVYLIEPTKILERHILGARYFSKESSFFTTYTDLINLILETCHTKIVGMTSPIDNFYFEDNGDERLLKEAREFQFSDTTTLFEALEEIALSINAYPRVVDFDKIIFEFFEDGEEKDINGYKIFNKNLSQDINRYSTNLFSTIKNAISSSEFSSVGNERSSDTKIGLSERTEVVRFTKDTTFLQTEYPIYKIKKISLVAGANSNTPVIDGFINNGLKFYTTIPSEFDATYNYLDLTNFVVEKKQWELFNDDIGNNQAWQTVYDPVAEELTGENSKLCSLYFEEGDNKIQNLYEYTKYGFLGTLSSNYSLFNIITVAIKTRPLSANIPGFSYVTNFADGVTPMFKITYETMGDYTLKQYRNKWEDFGSGENSIIYNQGGNLIDFELFGENIKGKIKRIGNKRYEVAFIADDYVNINLGDKIGEYVVTEINFETYSKYEKILLKLDKNFNRKSSSVTIESQKRLFTIPGNELTVERKINFQRFMKFSKEQEIQENDMESVTKELLARQFTSKGKESGVLYNLPTNQETIDYLIHTGFNQETKTFSTSFLKTPILLTTENAFSLNLSFDDTRELYSSINKKASMRARGSRLNSERKMRFYSDENGEVEVFEILAYDTLNNFVSSQADFSYNFPKVDIDFLSKLGNRLFGGQYLIKKDAREKLNFSLQFNFLSENKDIVLTKNLAKNNILFRGKNGKIYGNVKIQPLFEKENENYLIYDLTKGEAEELIDGVTISGFSCVFNKDENKLEVVVPELWKENKKAFAFLDTEDNIIMIVNDIDVDNIFINYSNKY